MLPLGVIFTYKYIPGHQRDGVLGKLENFWAVFSFLFTFTEEDAHKLDTAVVKGDILWQR